MLEFCSQMHEFGKPNAIAFEFVPENNLSLQDTKELNKTDVSTPKVKYIRSVNDSYISCKDNDAFPTKNRTTTHVRQIIQFQNCLPTCTSALGHLGTYSPEFELSEFV